MQIYDCYICSWLSSSGSASLTAFSFLGDVCVDLLALQSFFTFLLSIVLHRTQYYLKRSIHLDICVPSVSSFARTVFLYCGEEFRWWLADRPAVTARTSCDDQGITVRWPDGDQTNICMSSSGKFSFIHSAWSPSNHLKGIPGGPNRERPICGSLFPPNFRRWPTGHWQMFRRHPVGHRWMNEWPQTLGGLPANFNCELNLPRHRRTSARWVLYRRITARFLPDLMQKLPCGGRAAVFSLLGRRLYIFFPT